MIPSPGKLQNKIKLTKLSLTSVTEIAVLGKHDNTLQWNVVVSEDRLYLQQTS